MTGLCSEAWGERSGGTFGGIFRAEVTIVTEWNTWDVEQRPGPPSSAPHTYCIPSRARAFGADDLHAQLAVLHVTTTDSVPIVPIPPYFASLHMLTHV
jgi:hypothetical protein